MMWLSSQMGIIDMITKKEKIFIRYVDLKGRVQKSPSFNYREVVCKTTWFFLGIPVYSNLEILSRSRH
jgi:hypothetical protein